jgi:hypothetical protein
VTQDMDLTMFNNLFFKIIFFINNTIEKIDT